jgi:hypothetical protein
MGIKFSNSFGAVDRISFMGACSALPLIVAASTQSHAGQLSATRRQPFGNISLVIFFISLL